MRGLYACVFPFGGGDRGSYVGLDSVWAFLSVMGIYLSFLSIVADLLVRHLIALYSGGHPL